VYQHIEPDELSSGTPAMTLIILQIVTQSISSTFHWLGLYFGTGALSGPAARRRSWIIGSGIVAIAWLLGMLLLAANDFFRDDVAPPRIPLALGITLLFGYLLLLSRDFRTIIAAIPQHWLIGIQVFRILGGIFLIRWWQGELPAVFAIPAGVGDTLTGLFAPVVAYWWYTGKPYARTAAILWNLFGMADLVDAVVIGRSINDAGIVFPIVVIPIYGVPRGFLMHSYSLIGLLRRTSMPPAPAGAPEVRSGM
jgi:hypothetical protein